MTRRVMNAVHFAVNFLGVGWALNALVSVEIYNRVKDSKPAQSIHSSITNGVSWVGRKSGFDALLKDEGRKAKAIGEDVATIAMLGTGGFLVLPIQNFYASQQEKITRFVERTVDRISGKRPEESEAKAETPAEHKESFSHWLAGKALGFVAAVTGYVALAHSFPQTFARFGKTFNGAYEKCFPPKTLADGSTEKKGDYFFAEQIATVTSISVLYLAHSWLDRLFPPEGHDAEIKKESQER